MRLVSSPGQANWFRLAWWWFFFVQGSKPPLWDSTVETATFHLEVGGTAEKLKVLLPFGIGGDYAGSSNNGYYSAQSDCYLLIEVLPDFEDSKRRPEDLL